MAYQDQEVPVISSARYAGQCCFLAQDVLNRVGQELWNITVSSGITSNALMRIRGNRTSISPVSLLSSLTFVTTQLLHVVPKKSEVKVCDSRFLYTPDEGHSGRVTIQRRVKFSVSPSDLTAASRRFQLARCRNRLEAN